MVTLKHVTTYTCKCKKVYAGKVLCKDFKWDKSINEHCEKGRRGINLISNIGTFIHKGGINPIKSLELIKHVVNLSIYRYYCDEVWSDSNKNSKTKSNEHKDIVLEDIKR